MYEPLRRLLNVDAFTVLSPVTVDDCRALLSARLLSYDECSLRAGSILHDGRPLFFGEVTPHGFQIGQYRGRWGRRGYPRTQGCFQPTPAGTRVDVKVNDLPGRAPWIVGLALALLALPVLFGLLRWGGPSAVSLGVAAAAVLGYRLILQLYLHDDPTETYELLTHALHGRFAHAPPDQRQGLSRS